LPIRSTPVDRLPTISTPPPPSRHGSLRDRIGTIAELGARTLGAERCAIAFQAGASGADEVASAPIGDAQWDAVVNALLGALSRQLSGKRSKSASDNSSPAKSIETIALEAAETDAIARIGRVDARRLLAASAFSDAASEVRIAIVARADRTRDELDASLELVARAALSELALASARTSLDFWRSHGAERSRQAAEARRELMREREQEKRLNQAVAAARQARPAERFSRFGELVATGAGFDQWVVAIADSGTLSVAAASLGLDQFDLGKTNSALAQSFRRRIAISRRRDRDAGVVEPLHKYYEDRIFAGSYVCIPFDHGAIALASRDGRAFADAAEALLQRLAPVVSAWLVERELARRDALVRRLALRMFAAIDEERARIARDLHDDQAQMIAAIKIALEGRTDAARAIFQQVEQELRRKTRELRPAILANASLHEAIEAEFARLGRAGISTRLFHSGAVEKISRPVEQLCFQVVREALANVIRHARAKSVEVAIEKIDAAARVSVSDDGHGIETAGNEGVGMVGMRERLELMGGSLRIESTSGGTIVVAEIPEFS
jgi:signal transduction histidine kinase